MPEASIEWPLAWKILPYNVGNLSNWQYNNAIEALRLRKIDVFSPLEAVFASSAAICFVWRRLCRCRRYYALAPNPGKRKFPEKQDGGASEINKGGITETIRISAIWRPIGLRMVANERSFHAPTAINRRNS